jgi:steroid 5-alpha reductase family enzyme
MSYYITLALVLLAYMTLWFVVSIVKKRNDVADVAWGLGFVLLAWVSYFLGESDSLRSLIVVALVTVWGVRLASHIARPHSVRHLA